MTPISTFFFFNDTATTEIYTLSLHDALPISTDGPEPSRDGNAYTFEAARTAMSEAAARPLDTRRIIPPGVSKGLDRKSTRLNSSHANISYAVFCLQKKTPGQRSASMTQAAAP